MSPELILGLMIAAMLVLLAIGAPIAFALAGVATVTAALFWSPAQLNLLATSGFSTIQNINLAAIPLFVFMGWILRASGIADDMFEGMQSHLGGIPGGLAVGVIIVSTLLGAVIGSLVAALMTISAMAYEPMIKRGYDRKLTVGCIMAGSLLGLIIPPSVEIIVYSSATGLSIGRLYLAALGPGLLLAFLYIVYVLVRCRIDPSLGPPVTATETRSHWGDLRRLGVPLLLIATLMGGIYSGSISPLEASTVGVAGSLLIAIAYGRIGRRMIVDAATTTLRVTTMIAWLFIAIGIFSAVFNALGGLDAARSLAGGLPGGPWGAVIVSQIILFVGGAFIDDFAMIMLFGPIFSKIIGEFGFDRLWYAVLFILNMQMAFLTPPYGFALFCMRAAIPPGHVVRMVEIIRAGIPFILIQMVCIGILMAFPKVATTLPGLLVR